MRRGIRAAGIILLALTSCVTSGGGPGDSQGPIEAMYHVRQGWAEYAALKNAGHFAVTPDGLQYGYSYCSDIQCRGNTRVIALKSCEDRAERDCVIHGFKGEPVFGGDVAFLVPDPGPVIPATPSISLSAEASQAFSRWSTRTGAAAMAVNPSGTGWYYTVCRDAACYDTADREAVWACSKYTGTQCLLYGRRGRRVF